ncbi:helix-turn-helix domain-containing protein [Lacticaseibacillus sp. GG6-2]
MEFTDVFMERADQLKYRLYSTLARSDVQRVTIVDLADLTHNTYQPVYNVFQEMLSDIVMLTGLSKTKARKKILDAETLPLGLDAYRSYLVRNSLMYRLLDYAVTSTNPTAAQFEAQEFVSRSTMTRKLRAANDLMARYGVKFRLAKLAFSGNELNICFFLYAFYWWSHRGSYWPFKTITRKRLHDECSLIGIMNEHPVSQIQMQVFLAISHLRLAKNHPVQMTPLLERFGRAVNQQGFRKGTYTPPFTYADMLGYNFYQVSQPRFDEMLRTPEDIKAEMTLFADPSVLTVVAELEKVIPVTLTDAQELNLMRLTFGYLVCGGPYPQAQEIVAPDEVAVDPMKVAKMQQVLETLPEDAGFDALIAHAEAFARHAAELCVVAPVAPVRVHLSMEPASEGYEDMAGFINCVPWIAQTVESQDADLCIGVGDMPLDADPDITWFTDAVAVPSFREQVVNQLIAKAHQDSSHQRASQ